MIIVIIITMLVMGIISSLVIKVLEPSLQGSRSSNSSSRIILLGSREIPAVLRAARRGCWRQ